MFFEASDTRIGAMLKIETIRAGEDLVGNFWFVIAGAISVRTEMIRRYVRDAQNSCFAKRNETCF